MILVIRLYMTNMRVFTMIVMLGFASGLFRIISKIPRVDIWKPRLKKNEYNNRTIEDHYNGSVDEHLLLHFILG